MKPRSDDDDDDFYVQLTGVGTAHASLHSWTPTETERKQWKREQAAADKRKIPLGFAPPHQRKAKP